MTPTDRLTRDLLHSACAVFVAGAFISLAAPAAALAEGEAAAEQAAEADAGPLDGLGVAKKSDEARRADTEHQVMTMTLENSRGQKRVRTIEGWSKEIDRDTEHRFSLFKEPADVKDTTLLSYDYTYEDDDTWLYLPALKKVKRILSSNKSDYFMGSDFTYEDMENIDLINWDYTLVGEENVEGVDCYRVEAIPNNDKKADETAYTKTIGWYAKADFIPRRIDFFDKKDRHSKRLLMSDVRPTADDDPRPRAHRLFMENYITKHKTLLELKELKLDVNVDEDTFSQRNLRQ